MQELDAASPAPTGCDVTAAVAYVGSEWNYDEYQKLSVKQEIAEDRLEASMDWDTSSAP